MCSNKLLKHEWRDIESGGLQEFAFRLISAMPGVANRMERKRYVLQSGLSNINICIWKLVWPNFI